MTPRYKNKKINTIHLASYNYNMCMGKFIQDVHPHLHGCVTNVHFESDIKKQRLMFIYTFVSMMKVSLSQKRE